MLFNSISFLIFFAIVYLFYWNLTGTVRRNFLLFTSILFYAFWGLQNEGWWGLRWTAHFLGMALLNYFLVRLMLRGTEEKSRGKRTMIRLIIVLNLLNLGIFKYFSLLRKSLLDMGVGLPPEIEQYDIFLPLAISFYTFQMTAYAVDAYRGQIDKDEGIMRYLFFILFFPQLIAGPIMRSTDFMEQLDNPVMTRERMYDGCWLIMSGLVKKVLMADPMGLVIAPVYGNPDVYSGASLMLAGMCFSLQIYCDFSGYTDIARGAGRLLGYEIPENFKAPFFSLSAQELWNRWHITLATWLRDYIYFPLGGNRLGVGRTYINLFITMALGGLWHGADYTFVIWGAMWGLFLILERFFDKSLGISFVPQRSRILKVAKAFFVFMLFAFSALLFRAQPIQPDGISYSSERAMAKIVGGVFTNQADDPGDTYQEAGGDLTLANMTFGEDIFYLKEMGSADNILFMFLMLIFFHMVQYKDGLFNSWRKYDFWLLLIGGAILGGVLMPSLAVSGGAFIYFVF